MNRAKRDKGGAKEPDSGDVPTEVERTLAHLEGIAARVRADPTSASTALRDLVRSRATGPVAEEVVSRSLDRIKELDPADPKLAYALVMVLEQWVPEDLPPRLKLFIYQAIGGYALRTGEMERAIDALHVARASAEEADMLDAFVVLATELANALRRAGRPLEAIRVYEAAISAAEGPVEILSRARAYLNAATAYADLGMNERTRPLLKRAVALLADDPEHLKPLTVATVNLADSYFAEGNMSVAEEMTLRALDLAREADLPEQEGVALGHLGLIRAQQGDVSAAIRLIERAAALSEQLHDGWNAQHWFRDLANLYHMTGAEEAAVYYLEKALEQSRKCGDSRSEALALFGLGVSQAQARGFEERQAGREHLQDAWTRLVNIRDRLKAGEVALALAKVFLMDAVDFEGVQRELAAGASLDWSNVTVKDPHALTEARSWVERAEGLLREAPPGLVARLSIVVANLLWVEGRAEEGIERLEAALELPVGLMERASLEGGLAQMHLRGRASPHAALPRFVSALETLESVGGNIGWDRQRIGFRDSFAPLYMGAVQCAAELGDRARALEFCQRAKLAETRRLWSLRGTRPTRLRTQDEVAAAVVARYRTALVEFMPGLGCTFVFVFAPGLKERETFIQVEFDLIAFGGRSWTELQRAYDGAFGPSGGEPGSEERWRRTLETALRELGEGILEPVARRLAGMEIDEVFFAPHSLLHAFPLHAAPLDGGTWLDRYAISYVPTVSLACELWGASTPARPRPFNGFGDPQGDLPLARLEVRRAARGFADVEIHEGAETTRSNVLAALGKSSWLHFACHAEQALDDPDRTGLLLATGSDADAAGGTELLSLTTINRDVSIGRQAVIVLSACETGALTPRLSDQYTSIAGGFLTAGAGAVLASYWSVPDSCAALVIDRFYAELAQGGVGLAEALRRAQVFVRQLTQEEARDRLSSWLDDTEGLTEEEKSVVLREFEGQPPDDRPFESATDWAAFFLAGYGAPAA